MIEMERVQIGDGDIPYICGWIKIPNRGRPIPLVKTVCQILYQTRFKYEGEKILAYVEAKSIPQLKELLLEKTRRFDETCRKVDEFRKIQFALQSQYPDRI